MKIKQPRNGHLIVGNARDIPIEGESVQAIVTSPPYWGLLDYSEHSNDGLEDRPTCWSWANPNAEEEDRCGECYTCFILDVGREMWRVLKPDGVWCLNIGDTYASPQTGKGRARKYKSQTIGRARGRKTPEGMKAKDLVGVPWLSAFALRADGWYLRQEVIFQKNNPSPEPGVKDRLTRAHESVFVLTKSKKYKFYPSRSSNTKGTRSVWKIGRDTSIRGGDHPAVMPPELARKLIMCTTDEGDTVLDPFGGTGTVGMVAQPLNRKFVLVDTNPRFVAQMCQRIEGGSFGKREVRSTGMKKMFPMLPTG